MKWLLLLILVSCQSHGPIDDEKKIPKEYDPTICTRDINQWGHASKCKCPGQDQEYNQEKGKCFEK